MTVANRMEVDTRESHKSGGDSTAVRYAVSDIAASDNRKQARLGAEVYSCSCPLPGKGSDCVISILFLFNVMLRELPKHARIRHGSFRCLLQRWTAGRNKETQAPQRAEPHRILSSSFVDSYWTILRVLNGAVKHQCCKCQRSRLAGTRLFPEIDLDFVFNATAVTRWMFRAAAVSRPTGGSGQWAQ